MTGIRWLVAFAIVTSASCADDSRIRTLEDKIRGFEAQLGSPEAASVGDSTRAWILWQFSATVESGSLRKAQWMVVQSADQFARCEERLDQAVDRYVKILKGLKEQYTYTDGEHTIMTYGLPPSQTRYVCMPDTLDPRR